MYERHKTNLNMRGAFWRNLQTFVGSLIIIVSALVIRFTVFLARDPMGRLVTGWTTRLAGPSTHCSAWPSGSCCRGGSWAIRRSALRVLLQATPGGFDLDGAVKTLGGIEGVEDLHHVHAWSLTTGRSVFSAHLRGSTSPPAACRTPDAADTSRVLQEATDTLRTRFEVYLSTLHVEQGCLSEPPAAAIDITRPQAPV